MRPKPIPCKSTCDAVFEKELLPAVYRWISNLSPEELARFKTVFPVLATDDALRPSTTSKRLSNRL
jgi:hypothetical protein